MSGIANNVDKKSWSKYSAAYSFVGSELLMPMNRSGKRIGFDPGFWADMICPENDYAQEGRQRLLTYAKEVQANSRADDIVIPGMLQASTEYSRLFIDGAPHYVASPLQNDYGADEPDQLGMVHPSMDEVLEQEGIQFLASGKQRADHMGTELQYLSMICDKVARNLVNEETASEAQVLADKAKSFIVAYPLRWIGAFCSRINIDSPDGYYSMLTEYLHGVLIGHYQAME